MRSVFFTSIFLRGKFSGFFWRLVVNDVEITF